MDLADPLSGGNDERTVRLHPEVSVRSNDSHIDIRFAHWELKLPVEAVASDSEVRWLLDRRSAPSLGGSAFARGVRALLEAQGGLLENVPPRLTLRELYRLVQPIRSRLYAAYYAHPLWGLLSSGEAAMGQLAAWVIHNYHVSRSAGVIAARRASRTGRPEARQAYRKDALEEFWHCDAFYFVRHSRLTLKPDACKAYVPLPGSRAFEDSALRAADDDGVAHLLIAYFQESSIVFRNESESFYDRIEQRYGLRGFFDGWRRHLALDLVQDHAGGLAELFDSGSEVSREEAERAILQLQMAHFFLVAGLDQALSYTGEAADAIMDRQPDRLRALAERPPVLPVCVTNVRQGLIEALRDASFTALGRATSHDEIMVAGGLAAALERSSIRAETPDRNPWSGAARNFLIERASDIRVTLQLAREAIACLSSLNTPTAPDIASIEAEISKGIGRLGAGDRPIERLQLREFLSLAVATPPLLPVLLSNETPTGYSK